MYHNFMLSNITIKKNQKTKLIHEEFIVEMNTFDDLAKIFDRKKGSIQTQFHGERGIFRTLPLKKPLPNVSCQLVAYKHELIEWIETTYLKNVEKLPLFEGVK